jgi:hypothetical protein
MSAAVEPDPPKRRRIVRGGVRGAVRKWLAGRDLNGADLVRAWMALALAGETAAAAHAQARRLD